jgi:hypothetical protein
MRQINQSIPIHLSPYWKKGPPCFYLPQNGGPVKIFPPVTAVRRSYRRRLYACRASPKALYRAGTNAVQELVSGLMKRNKIAGQYAVVENIQ